MSLSRQEPGTLQGGEKTTVWEVDGSGLSVRSRPLGSWIVVNSHPDYLRAHGLENLSFSTRARAVDAVRLALAVEPLSGDPLTRWKRVSEGRYLSRDGRWRLERRGLMGDQLFSVEPLSQGQKELLDFVCHSYLLRSERSTLRILAQRVDRLNRMLDRMGPDPSRPAPLSRPVPHSSAS